MTKKRQINKCEWKSEKAKKAKLTGTEVRSKCGKPIAPAKMGFGCGPCRFSCQEKITVEQRKSIFDDFWSLEDHTRQWDYITRHTQTKPLKDSKSRNLANTYYLQVSYKQVKVCQTMFNHTLGKNLFANSMQ